MHIKVQISIIRIYYSVVVKILKNDFLVGFWSGPHACVGHMLVDHVKVY